MRKLLRALAVPLVVAGFGCRRTGRGSTRGPGGDAPPPVVTPWPGTHLAVMLYVDTVQNLHPKYGVLPTVGCSRTNFFKRGNGVVFRVWGIESSTGLILAPTNVKYAYVKIPGQPNLKLTFGKHGAKPDSPWFWTAAWDVAPDYPLGVVAFQVVFKTQLNKFGIFDQSALAADVPTDHRPVGRRARSCAAVLKS